MHVSLKNRKYILSIGGKYSIDPCVAPTQIFMSRTKMSDIHVKNYMPRNFIENPIDLFIFLEKILREANCYTAILVYSAILKAKL